jgi:GntR family transcriptional regulator
MTVATQFPPLPVDSTRLGMRGVRRVYDVLRASIRTGDVGQHEKLDEFRLVRSMRESRDSVREAMRMLADEGLLIRGRRVGTTVAHDITLVPALDEVIPIEEFESGSDQGRTVIYQLERRIMHPPEPVQKALKLDGAGALMLDQLVLVDGEVIGARTSYLAIKGINEDVLQTITGSTHNPLAYGPLFRQLFGTDVGVNDVTIESIACGQRTSVLLDIPVGSPILLVESQLRDSTGVPRCLCYAHLTGSKIALFLSGAAPSAQSCD